MGSASPHHFAAGQQVWVPTIDEIAGHHVEQYTLTEPAFCGWWLKRQAGYARIYAYDFELYVSRRAAERFIALFVLEQHGARLPT